MMWVLYFIVLWLSASVVILATGWYAAASLKQLWPEWWRQVVVDVDPYTETRHNTILVNR